MAHCLLNIYIINLDCFYPNEDLIVGEADLGAKSGAVWDLLTFRHT
jgi:hypothetical protein